MSSSCWELRYDNFGNPSSVLYLKTDATIPEPGPGQVRVKTVAVPLHPSTLLDIQGVYGNAEDRARREFPSCPTGEGYGIVDKLGQGVANLTVGQRVHFTGQWKEYNIHQAYLVCPIPDNVPYTSAAQLIVNPLAAWAMVDALALKEGDYLLQSAAGSTLGIILATQIAKIKNIKTINIVRRPEQVEELKNAGADEVICINDSNLDDLVPKVNAITGGVGARGAIDCVGGELASRMTYALAAGSTMLVYGLLSGRDSKFNNAHLLFRGITIKGFWLTGWITQDLGRFVRERTQVLTHMAENKIAPPVSKEFDFTDFKAAVESSAANGNAGKVLMVDKSLL